MKITKQGTPWWSGLDGACLECGAEFMLESGDRPVAPDRLPGSRLESDEFQCPSCGALVLVNNPEFDEKQPPGLIVGI